MKFSVVTIFPEIIEMYANTSIIGRAKKAGKIEVDAINPRNFTNDAHQTVDDRPYGGGPGMVMKPEPIILAVESLLENGRGEPSAKKKTKVIFFAPGGKQFDTKMAKKFSKYDQIVMIAGHYEGVDVRVAKVLKAEHVSVGPYVLSGGELPALILLDSISRQIKGVLGKDDSLEEKRISTGQIYTRPEILMHKGKKYAVPKILLSGNHAEINKWKSENK